MTPGQQQEAAAFHQQWLKEAVTRETRQLLDKHEEMLTKNLAALSTDNSLSDAQFRQYAVQLKTIKTIRNLIYDTETFVTKLGA